VYGDKYLDRPKSIEINNVLCSRSACCDERSPGCKHLRTSLAANLLQMHSIENHCRRLDRSPAGAGPVGAISRDAFGENLKVRTGIVFTSHSS